MASPVVFFRNRALSAAGTTGQTSTVGEPSLATNNGNIFFTGNWYASRSTDDGATWAFIDPFSVLPPADGGFCCDQTVIYIPGRNLTVWLLQYVEQNGTNTLRVAINPTAALPNAGWIFWDLKPGAIDPAWAGDWFDYNHAALSDNFLYVGSNMFKGDTWQRGVIFRIPLSVLQADHHLSFDYFQSTDNFSLRCAQGATSTMHIVSHNNLSQVRVFSWPEAAAQPTATDVSITPWKNGHYNSPGPDGSNWLSRCDDRITGVWLAGGVIGFMWTGNAMPPDRPRPYVRVVRLNETTKAVIDEPDIWNANYSYAFPDAYPNSAGEVGVTMFRGGGALNPSHIVGFRDEAVKAWRLRVTRKGTDGPSDNKWGDYLTCRRHAPRHDTWIATGYTLQGGGSRTNIEPRYVHFGH